MTKTGILKGLSRLESKFRLFSDPSSYHFDKHEDWNRYIPIQKKIENLRTEFELDRIPNIAISLKELMSDINEIDNNYLKLLIAAIEGNLEEYDKDEYWQVLDGELVFVNGSRIE